MNQFVKKKIYIYIYNYKCKHEVYIFFVLFIVLTDIKCFE